MKPTGLMIGDYVKYQGHIYIVEEISVKGWVHLIHPDTGTRVNLTSDYIIDLLEPIHLTPEFFERNNFNEFLGLGVFFSQYVKDKECSIMIDILFCKDSHIVVDIEKQSFTEGTRNSLHSCDIESLHEFQHALRQCGLDEWADNFNMEE